MLPIRDGQGRCCGFSGRSLNGEEPKYRNSSGDLLFQKSQLLFGLDRASDAMRRSGEALLVEGPLDVIQLHQAGLDHAVAALGTAVTIEQLQRLQRSGTRRLWLAYDGDSAGANATARLIGIARPLLLRGELDLLVVPVPPGEDPDSLLRSQGVSGLRACLAQGRHWLHWELDRLLAERRALRLFLCNPGLREVLSVLELADPLHREAMGWLWCLQQRLAGRDSAATVAGSNPSLAATR